MFCGTGPAAAPHVARGVRDRAAAEVARLVAGPLRHAGGGASHALDPDTFAHVRSGNTPVGGTCSLVSVDGVEARRACDVHAVHATGGVPAVLLDS